MDCIEFHDPKTNPEVQIRYGLYTIQTTLEDGMVYPRTFIVLRNGYGVITRFTRLHDFAGVYDKRTYRPLTSNPEKKLSYVILMLNYVLVDHGAEFKIRHIFDVTKPMLEQFFSSYAMEKTADGTFRVKSTIEKCISVVTRFMGNLVWKYGGLMKITKEDLYRENSYYNKRGKKITTFEPLFQVSGIPETDSLLRDIPTKVFEVLLPLAFRYAEDIAFGLCLQAFAGLRAGEVCNVRQESSPLGPGLTFIELEGKIQRIEIDLKKEYQLRSDRVSTGKIKKERIQCVYPAFIGTFGEAYRIHQNYLMQQDFESEYAPMFVNARGKAMRYESYRQKFQSLIKERLRPILLKSEDPELRLYGQILYENSLGLHALRHWYTVQLVLRGEDIAGIQYWRGDTSPESAFVYLQNKGDLNQELRETNDRLIDLLMDLGEELHDE